MGNGTYHSILNYVKIRENKSKIDAITTVKVIGMEPIFNESEALSRLGDNRDLLLKISIANFGANSAYAAGLKLQEALERDEKDKIPELYRAYIKHVEKLQAELTEFSKGVEPPEINS